MTKARIKLNLKRLYAADGWVHARIGPRARGRALENEKERTNTFFFSPFSRRSTEKVHRGSPVPEETFIERVDIPLSPRLSLLSIFHPRTLARSLTASLTSPPRRATPGWR